jgi:integrase
MEPPHKSAQGGSGQNVKSARKVQERASLSKGDSRYWMAAGRLKKSNGSPNYSVQIQFKGKRMGFTTRTANKEAAAKIAASIYTDLLKFGPDATLAKHRPQEPIKEVKTATIGEWIDSAKEVAVVNASTFNCYACSLRLIASQILRLKKTKRRFGPKKGGSSAYRGAIDAASLEILTPTAIQQWRKAYVRKAKNPAEQRSRMTSCNSTIRQARSLFAGKIVRYLPTLRLPKPPPFEGVELYPRQSAKYFSRIDAKELLLKAEKELRWADTPAFVAMLLALGAGLRRKEIDSLCWHQVDFDRELLRIEATDKAQLKTSDSRGEVFIDSSLAALLKEFHAGADSEFVIQCDGKEGGVTNWGQKYRADAVFDRLNDWLRANGVKAQKPLHELRKELGALVTSEHGIYAASRILRHSDVSTTARHYSDLKTRPVVDIGGWLLNAEPKAEREPEGKKVLGNATANKPLKKGRK